MELSVILLRLWIFERYKKQLLSLSSTTFTFLILKNCTCSMRRRRNEWERVFGVVGECFCALWTGSFGAIRNNHFHFQL